MTSGVMEELGYHVRRLKVGKGPPELAQGPARSYLTVIRG